MKVVSTLADLDFDIGSAERAGNALKISNRTGSGIPTSVYVRPQDVLRLVAVVLSSTGGLAFILGFPVFWWRARKDKPARPGAQERMPGASMNKPW